MNSRLLVAFLALVAAAPGCIIHDHDDDWDDNPPVQQFEGDVTFRWTFGGLRCDEDRDIRGVNIIIQGERLANDGRYACQANGFDGIVLHDFVPGTYPFNIEAISYANERLYVASGTFTVNGDVTVEIDLTPVGSPPSFAYVNWLFQATASNPSPSCTQAGVAYVDARVDGGDWARFACVDGQNGDNIRTPYLQPGAHTLDLVGVASDGRTDLYTYTGQFTTRAGAPAAYTVTLRPLGGNTGTGGSAAIRWQFASGSSTLGCSQAGVTHVDARINNGAWVRFTCAEGNGTGASVQSPTLQPGNEHYLEIVAFNSSSPNTPRYYYGQTFSIQAGVVTQLTANMWLVGGASIKWDLKWGSSPVSCSQAGLTDVAVNFRDVYTNELVYGVFGDRQKCTDGVARYIFLRPGRYEVELSGQAADGRRYASDDAKTYVDVVAHQFPSETAALPVTLYKQ
ncbi:MAG TPA: hypothetical protein VE153_15490 [Myxococcus sp.]|nr:hypothetical protein [Myxococcus sp.]